MSYYELLNISQSLSPGALREIVAIVTIISVAIMALSKLIGFILGGRKRVIDKLATRVCKQLDERLTGIEDDHKALGLVVLENTLTDLYFRLIVQAPMSSSMYSRFMATFQVYEARGGNGVIAEYKGILQSKKRAEISMPKENG